MLYKDQMKKMENTVAPIYFGAHFSGFNSLYKNIQITWKYTLSALIRGPKCGINCLVITDIFINSLYSEARAAGIIAECGLVLYC